MVGDLEPEAARADEASALLSLREEAAEWMRRRQVHGWASGEVGLDEIAEQIERQEWFVLRDRCTVVAAVRVVTSDDAIWGPRPDPALYVHSLMVDRRFAGRRFGRRLLAWVEQVARATGRPFVRLDCAETNEALRRYYRAAGYREVGRRDFSTPSLAATLLEKPLRSG
jgi:ribosomal protein S18 acetylase RimI-like enzyme